LDASSENVRRINRCNLDGKRKARLVIMGLMLWVGFMAVCWVGVSAMLAYLHAQEATAGQAIKAAHSS